MNIPWPLSLISYVVPAHYYIQVTRDAYVRGTGWPGVWYAPLALAALVLLFFAGAWQKHAPHAAAAMSRFGRLGALIRKEFERVLRDRTPVAFLIVPPALQLLVFGYALRPQAENIPLGASTR